MSGDSQSGWSFAFHEFAYDVYARILAGVFFLVSCSYTYLCVRLTTPPPHIDLHSFAVSSGGVAATCTFVGLVIAWIIGLILAPIGELVLSPKRYKDVFEETAGRYHEVFERAIDEKVITHKCANSRGKPHPGCCDKMPRHSYHQLHEYLKALRPDWQAMVTKLQAEARFYQNILAASVVVIVGNLAFHEPWFGYYWSWHWAISIVPLVAVGYVAWEGWRRKVESQWERQFAMFAAALQLKDHPSS
jgi:hypothetical protein